MRDKDDKSNGDPPEFGITYREHDETVRSEKLREFMRKLGLDENGEDISEQPAAEVAAVSAATAVEPAPRAADIKRAVNKNVHAGHRERLRASALKDPTLDSFSDVEIIELLLSFMIPRKDTNVLAHALLEKYGSVLGVLTAPEEELVAVPNMTRNAAEYLAMIPEIGRLHRDHEITIADGASLVNHFLAQGIDQGETIAVYLDDSYCLIADERYRTDAIPVREIIASVCRLGAKHVFVGRSMNVADRVTDEPCIARLEKLLDAVDAELDDYIQFGESGYGSRLYDRAVDPSDKLWQYMPAQTVADSTELMFKLQSTDDGDD